MGLVCGVLGALFVQITVWNGVWRKKYINTDLRKVLECLTVALITASAFYGAVYFRRNQCRPVDFSQNYEYTVQWLCPNNEYNPLATILLNTERGTLEEFFRYPEIISLNVSKE